MKKLLATIAAVIISTATYGQGQVNFDNLFPGAPITLENGEGPGAAGKAQLYLVTGDVLAPIGPIAGFLTSSSEAFKYIDDVVVNVPGVAEGASATFRIRAWADAAGNWEDSLIRGESNDVLVDALGGGTVVPPNLDGLQAFTLTVIPEPSTIALGLIGAGALLLRRRKK